MLSSKPYLLQAMYQWILDSSCTPHIVVDATLDAVRVPAQYVKNGQIVLNISPTAVQSMSMDKQAVAFNARFGGQPLDIYVPMYAIMGVYARENGRGMMFEPEEMPEPDATPPQNAAGKSKPVLRVVK